MAVEVYDKSRSRLLSPSIKKGRAGPAESPCSAASTLNNRFDSSMVHLSSSISPRSSALSAMRLFTSLRRALASFSNAETCSG